MPKRVFKKSNVKVAFGRIVRMRRMSMGVSQEKLAELSGLHRNYLGSLERGERNVGIENIYKIATALETHPKELLP